MSMNIDRQKILADEFLALHRAPSILFLPNAWDVASSKVFELEGFKAIGTTSAGIAASLGYADGQRMSLHENISVARRIIQSTCLPVTVDLEAGYADSVEGIVASVREAMNVGAIGINLEDSFNGSMFDTILHQEKIKAIREMAITTGVHLFINARTDSYMIVDDPTECLRQSIERGNAYKEAGADGVFVPDVGLLDRKAISILVKEINAPLNILAGIATPSILELQNIGVARVSVGPRPMRALLSALRKMAQEWVTDGTYKLMSASTISYSEVNEWFNR
ncbi:isocitrate lyase/phosphoenolpyruvate mutase family protein [bacterium]|nr:isocitrate lyase/phosphoenolpyruvate mutase family protein [bacterium]